MWGSLTLRQVVGGKRLQSTGKTALHARRMVLLLMIMTMRTVVVMMQR